VHGCVKFHILPMPMNTQVKSRTNLHNASLLRLPSGMQPTRDRTGGSARKFLETRVLTFLSERGAKNDLGKRSVLGFYFIICSPENAVHNRTATEPARHDPLPVPQCTISLG
ncbi:uncharacterized, partial [Tachysurus ichikawai]